MSQLTCGSCSTYLFDRPLQCPRGDCLCFHDTTSVAILTMAKPSVQYCQEGHRYECEKSSVLTYNCIFSWKISGIEGKRAKAVSGETSALYSDTFYIHGCNLGYILLLYMDGDGIGRGTHLSLFYKLTSGDYDSQLQWPFKQTIRFVLQSHDGKLDIIHELQPDEKLLITHASENIALGCPKFAPLCILENNSYVKDDAMTIKCIIDTTGI